MSIKTRKGLAVSAAGALALTGLSALPAQALSVSLVVAEGSSYVGVAGEAFDLTGRWSNDFANWNNAIVEVTNADGMDYAVAIDDANAVVGGGAGVAIAVAAADASDTGDISDTDGSNLTITVTPTDETDVGDVTVLVGIDADGSGSLESGEVRASRTITFLDPADLTVTSSVSSAVIGATDITIGASLSGNVNLNYVTLANFNATVEDGAGGDILTDTDDGGAGDTTDEVGLAGGLDLNAAGTALTLAGLGVGALAAGDKVVVQVTYTDVGANAIAGTLARGLVAETDLNAVADDVTETDNVRVNGNNVEVRAGYTGNVSISFAATDAAGDAVASERFDVVVADNALVDDTITVNGETLAAAGDDIEFEATSNASGAVTVVLSSDAGTNGDVIDLTVTSVLDPSKSDTMTVTWVTAGNYVIENLSSNVEDLIVAADETTHSVVLTVFDDYGALVGSGFRFEIDNGTDQTFKNLSNGKASMSYTLDNADVDFNLEEQAANGNYAGTGDTYTLTWVDADAQFDVDDAQPVLAAANDGVLGEALVVADVRGGDATPAYAAGDGIALGGDLVDLGGNVVVGYVTISATGLAFSWNDELYTKDSITIMTDAAGAWDVEVYGNVSGDYTITVVAGGVSEELDFEIDAADETTATNVTLNIVNAAQGKTMTVSGVVTDDWGNTIDNSDGDLTITYTGPGFINGALPTQTDANGEYKFQVLIGASDVVEGSVEVILDGDSDGDNTDAETVTVEKDLVPAVPAADTKVNAGSFKGYVAVYAKGHEGKRLSAKIGNDWVVVESLASNFERIVDFTGAGYTISVRIYIDRVLEDTIVVTTK